MSEAETTKDDLDRRQAREIPMDELIKILGEKLRHHPLGTFVEAETREAVASIFPPPNSPEPLPFEDLGGVIREIRKQTMHISTLAGVQDIGINTETLLKWGSEISQIALNTPILGSKNAYALMEIYAEIESARQKIQLMKTLSRYMKKIDESFRTESNV